MTKAGGKAEITRNGHAYFGEEQAGGHVDYIQIKSSTTENKLVVTREEVAGAGSGGEIGDGDIKECSVFYGSVERLTILYI